MSKYLMLTLYEKP